MSSNMNLFQEYKGITRYAGVPTEQLTGRLHYNENLYGPSPKCMETLKELVPSDLYLYESGFRDDLTDAISEKIGIPAENIFLNNGSAEIIKSIYSIVANRECTVLLPNPGWSYYYGLADYKFCKPVLYDILEDGDKCRHDVEAIRRLAAEYHPRLIFITSPAMPTGNVIDPDDLEGIVRDFQESIVLVDEAYLGFAPYQIDCRRMIETYDNIIFSRTFSKYYGLANLRIGYGFCSTALKGVLWLDMPLHRLPHICKRMAIAALKDNEYYDMITAKLIASREKLIETLNRLPGVTAFKSDANFIYVRTKGYDPERIKEICAENGYLVRIFTNGVEKHLRMTIATEDVMESFTKMLLGAFEEAKLEG